MSDWTFDTCNVNNPLYDFTYDETLLRPISKGELNLVTLTTSSNKSTYLRAALEYSDDAFIEAVESGIPLPTLPGDLQWLIADAYDFDRKKSIAWLRSVATPEYLTILLNEHIKVLTVSENHWLINNEKRFDAWRQRLIRDGAVLSDENKQRLLFIKKLLTQSLDSIEKLI
jgi:hypothetical protein